MTKSRFDFKEKNLGVNILLVSTFWDHILVPNLKKYIYILVLIITHLTEISYMTNRVNYLHSKYIRVY